MLIAGVDEVGRGPLAGPVVAAVAVFEEGYKNPAIKDSKQLSRKKREQLEDVIKGAAQAWAIVSVGPRTIETINIRAATRLAMSMAVSKIRADLVLIDGNMEIETALPQKTVIKGDTLHVEISAASILAKVYRDRLMDDFDQKYPGYDFSKHAGYPTAAHKAAVAALGPCPIHRRTFAGVQEHIPPFTPTGAGASPGDDIHILP